ncbi:Thioesterase domain [Dillenia turbinata]|uniref:Acyl-coenzyme A thioesterase 13 n=1 Tax=Dillenia turbinata TaxID=194707 RepID=A0AAN8YT60_9MAGN
MENRDSREEKAMRYLQDLCEGKVGGAEFEFLCLRGIQDILFPQEGLIRCNYTVPDHASDENGNWHVGAMATLMDVVGGTAIRSITGNRAVSVDFAVSYLSTAKIHDEVEIEAKVVGHKGKLPLVEVEVRRKSNRDLIATSRQWASSVSFEYSDGNPVAVSKL